jgi:hypothetical protein
MSTHFTIVLAAMLLPQATAEDAEPADAPKNLTTSDERFVRQLIYGGDHSTVIPKEGKYELKEILVVPDQLARLYEKEPQATLDLLLKIMDGAKPGDSVLSAAYAASLSSNNPVIGAGVLRLFDESKYDEIDEDWGVTPRQYWIAKVKKKLRPEN